MKRKGVIIVYIIVLFLFVSCGEIDKNEKISNNTLENYNILKVNESLDKYIKLDHIIEMDNEELKKSGQFDDSEIESGELETTYMTFSLSDNIDWNSLSTNEKEIVAEATVDHCHEEMENNNYPGSCIVKCHNSIGTIYEWNSETGMTIYIQELVDGMKQEKIIREYDYMQ